MTELERIDHAITIEERLATDPNGSDWSRGVAARNLHELIGKRARIVRGGPDLPTPQIEEPDRRDDITNLLCVTLFAVAFFLYIGVGGVAR